MASADESISAVSAAVSKSDEADAAIGSAVSGVDELTSALESAGVQDRASMSADARSKLDEAATQLAGVKQTLEAALGLLNAVKGLRDQAPNATIPPNRPTPLNAAPAHLREPVAKVGDAVRPGPVAADPYRQELSGNDDSDNSRSRAQRFGRAFIRNAGGLQDGGKDAASTGQDLAAAWENPHGSGQTIESVGVAQHQPSIQASTPTHADVGDVVGNMVVLSAVLVEGTSRWTRRWRKGTTSE